MSKKQYGVLRPKKLDYLLAAIAITFAISALWIGIWVAATGTFAEAILVFENIVNAFIFNFAVEDYLVTALQSVIVYAGMLAVLIATIWLIAKKRPWVIQGVVALLIGVVALTFNVGFIGVYVNVVKVGVSGVFVTVLGILTLLLLLLSCKAAKLSLRLLRNIDQYWAYVDEEPAIEEPVLDEPVEEDEDDDYVVVNIADELDGYWENSNAYKDEVVAPEPKREEPKKEPVREQPKAEEPKAEEPIEEKGFGIKSNHYTFEQKLKKAKPQTRQYFKEIKKYFEEIGFKTALTKSAQIFLYKNTKYAMITTAGQNGLKIYYKLDPKDYAESTIPIKDVGDKRKYEKTPLLFVVKSDLAVRRAKQLMDDIKKSLENK